ncbi:MAG: hypothetical protein D6712_20915 [Chloroflexi bacterium]|nr:MAG: hypothetical protein D6712_20915 [Chloroflexota bacterium]
MIVYQVALGHNNVANLQDIVRQPRLLRLEYATVRTTGAGKRIADGALSGILEFNYLSTEDLSNILSQFGFIFGSSMSSEVTVRIPNQLRIANNYNAIAWYPDEAYYEMKIWRDIRIRLTHIEAL